MRHYLLPVLALCAGVTFVIAALFISSNWYEYRCGQRPEIAHWVNTQGWQVTDPSLLCVRRPRWRI